MAIRNSNSCVIVDYIMILSHFNEYYYMHIILIVKSLIVYSGICCNEHHSSIYHTMRVKYQIVN